MPRQIAEDDEKPRRRRRAAAVAVEAEPERGLIMRVLLHSPKDTLAAAAALAAVIAIVTNAMFLQAGRHPSPMFSTAAVSALPAALAPSPAPLPRVRPAEAEPRVAAERDRIVARDGLLVALRNVVGQERDVDVRMPDKQCFHVRLPRSPANP